MPTTTVTQEIVSELELIFDEVRTNYSGRGMFGQKCLGLVVDDPTAVASTLFEEYKDAESYPEFQDLLDVLLSTPPQTDNMGLSYIVYWSRVSVED